MKMATNKNEQRQRTKRRKQLRKGLLAFLKRLRKACKSYQSLADWNDLIEPLENLIDEYAQEMPPGSAQRLQDAMRLKAATAQGIQAGCRILQREVEGVISLLPAGAILGTALIAAFIVVAVAVAASAAVISATARQVVISTQRCGDIRLPSLGFSLPGLYIPPEIQNDRSSTATIPGFLKVDAEVRQQEKTMTVWIFNRPLRFSFDSQIESLTFDGAQLMNQRKILDFGNRPSHQLIFTCP
jgi:hypothetical protein